VGVDAPRILIGAEELATGVARLGAEISAAYGDGVVLVAVLKGSAVFLADLVRAMTVVPHVDFLAISPYAPGTGRVQLLKDLEIDIAGRDVVLVEDIVDTGLTATYILGELARRSPRSLAACALLDRRTTRIVPTPLAFVGFSVGTEFLVGYGLDFSERYRNLDMVAVGDIPTLQNDRDAYVKALYGR